MSQRLIGGARHARVQAGKEGYDEGDGLHSYGMAGRQPLGG
jgi:hypothetical protein